MFDIVTFDEVLDFVMWLLDVHVPLTLMTGDVAQYRDTVSLSCAVPGKA